MLGTEVFVSVGRIREIAITMTGEVRNPGVVTVSGLASLVDALRLSGGIKKTGSLRNAKIFRQGETIPIRSEEHTSELQSLMRNSYAVFCLNKKTQNTKTH